MLEFVAEYRAQASQAFDSINLNLVAEAIQWLEEARDQGNHIFVCGNGGSASNASHFACDMVKGASLASHESGQKRFRIMALTDQIPTITAYANDLSYDKVFVEQLRNFAQPGDVFIGISGSGNSMNVIHALEYANQAGCKTIALTGRDGGKLAPLAQLSLHVRASHMGRIEDAHMMICHMICYYFMGPSGGL